MHHEEMIQKIEHTVNNVNDAGLELIIRFIGGMEETEMYNINTSEERIEEIKQEKAKEEAERKARKEAEERAKPSPYTLNPTMQMLGHQCCLALLDQAHEEMNDILKARPNTATFDTALDILVLGYIYGKRAERKRRRGVHHGR
ncbi:MAG: hypothetical protein ACOCM4_08725 [Acetivibrio ethanolgignens]